MEMFVHVIEPKAVLGGFYRILRPGGRLLLFEYDHNLSENPREASMRLINEYAAMPTNALSQPGVFQKMLEEACFTDVVVRDYSENIKFITRLFFLHLEWYFINTVAGVNSYQRYGQWQCVAISATKPGGSLEAEKRK